MEKNDEILKKMAEDVETRQLRIANLKTEATKFLETLAEYVRIFGEKQAVQHGTKLRAQIGKFTIIHTSNTELYQIKINSGVIYLIIAGNVEVYHPGKWTKIFSYMEKRISDHNSEKRLIQSKLSDVREVEKSFRETDLDFSDD